MTHRIDHRSARKSLWVVYLVACVLAGCQQQPQVEDWNAIVTALNAARLIPTGRPGHCNTARGYVGLRYRTDLRVRPNSRPAFGPTTTGETQGAHCRSIEIFVTEKTRAKVLLTAIVTLPNCGNPIHGCTMRHEIKLSCTGACTVLEDDHIW